MDTGAWKPDSSGYDGWLDLSDEPESPHTVPSSLEHAPREDHELDALLEDLSTGGGGRVTRPPQNPNAHNRSRSYKRLRDPTDRTFRPEALDGPIEEDAPRRRSSGRPKARKTPRERLETHLDVATEIAWERWLERERVYAEVLSERKLVDVGVLIELLRALTRKESEASLYDALRERGLLTKEEHERTDEERRRRVAIRARQAREAVSGRHKPKRTRDARKNDRAPRTTIPRVRPPEGPPRPPGSVARVLAAKVDTMHLSFHQLLSPEWLEELEARREDARENRGSRVIVHVAGVAWEVCTSGAGRMYRYRLTNEYADLAISRSISRQVPQLRFEFRSAFLWERGAEGAWLWAREIATSLHADGIRSLMRTAEKPEPDEETLAGVLRTNVPRSVLTRADLCVDVQGADFAEAVLEHFVMRPRRKARHRCETKCPECRGTGSIESQATGEHWSGLEVSGFSFGRGVISARIYDKTREIREISRDKVWLYGVWAERGWVATETVWRVEVQLRREALRELVSERTERKLELDTLEGFKRSLGSIWGYAVGGVQGSTAWLKWTEPNEEDGRRSRWEPRPEWRVVQGAGWNCEEREALVRRESRQARYHQLVAQLTGLGVAVAALRGPNEHDGREPMLWELEEDVRLLLQGKGVTWTELVNDRRVKYDLERVKRPRAERKLEEAHA